MQRFWQSSLITGIFLLLLVLMLVEFGRVEFGKAADGFQLQLYVFPDGVVRSPLVPTTSLIPAGCSQRPNGPADVNCPSAPIKADVDYRLIVNGRSGNVDLELTNETRNFSTTLGTINAASPLEGTFTTSLDFAETDLWSIQAKQGSVRSNKIFFYVLSTPIVNVNGQPVNLCNFQYQCYLGFCYRCPSGVNAVRKPRDCSVVPPSECKLRLGTDCKPVPIRER